MPARRLPLPTRVVAWLYTGPIGHLYGGLADWAGLLSRHALSRALARVRGRKAPASS
jgi:hypothetical protein